MIFSQYLVPKHRKVKKISKNDIWSQNFYKCLVLKTKFHYVNNTYKRSNTKQKFKFQPVLLIEKQAKIENIEEPHNLSVVILRIGLIQKSRY